MTFQAFILNSGTPEADAYYRRQRIAKSQKKYCCSGDFSGENKCRKQRADEQVRCSGYFTGFDPTYKQTKGERVKFLPVAIRWGSAKTKQFQRNKRHRGHRQTRNKSNPGHENQRYRNS